MINLFRYSPIAKQKDSFNIFAQFLKYGRKTKDTSQENA
jgi:hypothetical protein